MLFAFSADNSRKSDVLTARLTTSEVWTRELAGPMNALRRGWGFGNDVSLKEFWSGFLVRGTRAQVESQGSLLPEKGLMFLKTYSRQGKSMTIRA